LAVEEALLARERYGGPPLEIAGLGQLLLAVEAPFLGLLAADQGEGEVDVLADLVAMELGSPDRAEAIGGEHAQIGRDRVASPLPEERVDEGDTVLARDLVDLHR